LKSILESEWLPLVNHEGLILGMAPRSVCHNGSNLLHPVVHLHIFNSLGELFLQKRPLNKLVQPGKWDTAVGGHVSYGDDIIEGLKRETLEETGIVISGADFFKRYIWKSTVEHELVYMFTTTYDHPIEINTGELDDGRFWTEQEIKAAFGNNIFTPNLEYELELLLNRP